MGYVYILTNPSFEDWVKIGMTKDDNVQTRVDSLNSSTAVPFSFRIFATLQTEKPADIESKIHAIFDTINPELHAKELTAKGTPRQREFFRVSPERALTILKLVADLAHISENIKCYKPTNEEEIEETESESISKKSSVSFQKLGISNGDSLIYLYDDKIKCEVVDNELNRVCFEGKNYSLSGLAKTELGYKSMNGFKIFTFENETLWNRKIRMELV